MIENPHELIQSLALGSDFACYITNLEHINYVPEGFRIHTGIEGQFSRDKRVIAHEFVDKRIRHYGSIQDIDFLDFILVDNLEKDSDTLRLWWPLLKIGGIICEMTANVNSGGRRILKPFKKVFISTSSGHLYYQKKRWVIVIGCGRSGTRYAAHAYRRGGLSMYHERYALDGTSRWTDTVLEQPPGTILLHQVRNPLKVIESSYSRLFPVSTQWLYRCPGSFQKAENRLRDVMWYWYYWNKCAEVKATITYRVEDMADSWDEILSLCGVDSVEFPESLPRNINGRKETKGKWPTFTWKDLHDTDKVLCDQIIGMGIRYGYKLEGCLNTIQSRRSNGG